MFSDIAKKLIDEKGPHEALAAALAYISGVTELSERSLLSSMSVSVCVCVCVCVCARVHVCVFVCACVCVCV